MQSRATITSEIASSFPTNNTKYITAQFLRTFQEIVNSSKFNLVDDNLSDIQFSRPDFQAGNALDAIIDLAQLARPIFYVDFKLPNFIDADLMGTNFTGLTINRSGSTLAIDFPSVFAASGGASIKKDWWHRSVTDTQILIDIDNMTFTTGITYRFVFYQAIPTASYLIQP